MNWKDNKVYSINNISSSSARSAFLFRVSRSWCRLPRFLDRFPSSKFFRWWFLKGMQTNDQCFGRIWLSTPWRACRSSLPGWMPRRRRLLVFFIIGITCNRDRFCCRWAWGWFCRWSNSWFRRATCWYSGRTPCWWCRRRGWRQWIPCSKIL